MTKNFPQVNVRQQITDARSSENNTQDKYQSNKQKPTPKYIILGKKKSKDKEKIFERKQREKISPYLQGSKSKNYI